MKRMGLVILSFTLVGAGCTSSGPRFDGIRGIFGSSSDQFTSYKSVSGAEYKTSVSDQKDETGPYKLIVFRDETVKGNEAIVAATPRVDRDAGEYIDGVVCKGQIYPAPTPAKGANTYDLSFDGWGYKARCGS